MFAHFSDLHMHFSPCPTSEKVRYVVRMVALPCFPKVLQHFVRLFRRQDVKLIQTQGDTWRPEGRPWELKTSTGISPRLRCDGQKFLLRVAWWGTCTFILFYTARHDSSSLISSWVFHFSLSLASERQRGCRTHCIYKLCVCVTQAFCATHAIQLAKVFQGVVNSPSCQQSLHSCRHALLQNSPQSLRAICPKQL